MKERLKKINNPEFLFILAWVIFLISQFMSQSMMKYELNDIIFKSMLLISYIIFIIKVFLYDFKYYLSSIKIEYKEKLKCSIENKEIFFRICTLGVLSLGGVSLFLLKSDSSIIKLTILLLGATNIDLKKIVKSYFLTILLGMTIMFIFSQINIVENLVYTRSDGTVRNSFGLLYPTNFSARIFLLVLCYAYLKDFKLKLFELLGIGLISYGTLIFTDGRLDVYSMLMILIIILIKKMDRTKQNIVAWLSLLSIPLSVAFTILSSLFYSPENKLLFYLDRLLSNRLKLGNETFIRYNPFTLFGQVIESNGWGGLEGRTINPADYFYIDSSYLKILFSQGLVTFLIVLSIIIYSQFKFVKNKKFNIVFVFALMGIYSIVSEFLIRPEYFPFILALYAVVEEEDNKIDQIIS